jgi:hypothetical protein
MPSKVLLESAKENIGQLNKGIAIDLVNENDKIYGQSQISRQLLNRANAISKAPDNRVAFSLSQPSPGEEAITPFLGKWTGTVVVPGGTDTGIEWEIKNENGTYVMVSDVMKQFKTTSDFLYVNEKKELVWGRKHDGGGIYISIGALSGDGHTITGTEDLIGFAFPAGMPAFKKNTFTFNRV